MKSIVKQVLIDLIPESNLCYSFQIVEFNTNATQVKNNSFNLKKIYDDDFIEKMRRAKKVNHYFCPKMTSTPKEVKYD